MFSARPARYGSSDGRDLRGVPDAARAWSPAPRPAAAGNSTLSRLVSRSSRPKTSHVPPAPSASSAASSSVGRRPATAGGRSATDASRGRQVRAPQPVRVGLDLVVGAPAEHRAGVVLGVPAVDGVLVVLVQQQPLLLAAELAVPVAHQHEPAAQLLAVQVGVQLARRADRGRPGRPALCGSQVPESQTITSPPPYSPAGMTPSKSRYSIGWSSTWTAVRRAFGSSVGPLRHRPADQHAVDLEPQVVVQPPGPVPLHDEAQRAAAGGAGAGAPAGSGVRAKSRFRRYGDSGSDFPLPTPEPVPALLPASPPPILAGSTSTGSPEAVDSTKIGGGVGVGGAVVGEDVGRRSRCAGGAARCARGCRRRPCCRTRSAGRRPAPGSSAAARAWSGPPRRSAARRSSRAASRAASSGGSRSR